MPYRVQKADGGVHLDRGVVRSAHHISHYCFLEVISSRLHHVYEVSSNPLLIVLEIVNIAYHQTTAPYPFDNLALPLKHSSVRRLKLNLLRSDLLLSLQVLNSLHAGQTQGLIDSLHTLTISLSNTVHGAAKEYIQLFGRLVLGLWSELPDEKTAKTAEEGKEDVSAVLHGVQHVLGSQANDEIEHPVCGGDDRDTAGAHAVGEDFLGEDPGDGA